jgi:hypothetical protein
MAIRSEEDHIYVQPTFDGLVPSQIGDCLPSGQTQYTIFQADVAQGTEEAERLVRIEGCQVVNPPVVSEWVEKKQKKKAWVCTFVAPADLWNQERSDWIQTVTENKQDIPVLNKLKLSNGDMCTVVGIQTGQRDEPMAKGDAKRRITFVKVTEVIPGIRGASKFELFNGGFLDTVTVTFAIRYRFSFQ